MTRYAGWWEVPEHLMSAAVLADLEFPRTPPAKPAAWVETRDWRGKKTTVALYDARTAPASKATAARLESAAGRATRTRTCAECGANCQRKLPTDVQDRPLCPACRSVALLREAQARAAADRAEAAATAAKWLSRPGLAVVQVDLTVPPPAPSGRARPATAARVRAVNATGAQLVDATIRLVGPRAQHVPAEAVDRAEAAPRVHDALIGRPLLSWDEDDLQQLRTAAPHQDWPSQYQPDRYTAVRHLSARWRGQLDPRTRNLLAALPPGTPDRLALHLRRIAATLHRNSAASSGGTVAITAALSAPRDQPEGSAL